MYTFNTILAALALGALVSAAPIEQRDTQLAPAPAYKLKTSFTTTSAAAASLTSDAPLYATTPGKLAPPPALGGPYGLKSKTSVLPSVSVSVSTDLPSASTGLPSAPTEAKSVSNALASAPVTLAVAAVTAQPTTLATAVSSAKAVVASSSSSGGAAKVSSSSSSVAVPSATAAAGGAGVSVGVSLDAGSLLKAVKNLLGL
ncbi:hypothetical protein SLS54_008098 [Diplodia seriata]